VDSFVARHDVKFRVDRIAGKLEFSRRGELLEVVIVRSISQFKLSCQSNLVPIFRKCSSSLEFRKELLVREFAEDESKLGHSLSFNRKIVSDVIEKRL
jgi:hypothetical protein